MHTSALQPPKRNRYLSAARKYLEPGPAHILMYTAGRFNLVRNLAVSYYQMKRGRKAHSHIQSVEQTLLQDLDVPSTVADLNKNGFAPGLKLRPEVLAEVQEFCGSAYCFGNGERNSPFLMCDKAEAESKYGRSFSTGRYLNCSRLCSTIGKIVEDPGLLAIARGYLGAEPVTIGARCWWSFAGSTTSQQQASDGQSFHYDLDDYRAVCFFFYLTDVDGESGAHVLVPSSHRRKPMSFLLSPFKSRTDEDIKKAYGADKIVSVNGKAGDGFAEDLFCYHKGSHPKSRDRLLLQVRFRLQDLGGVTPDE